MESLIQEIGKDKTAMIMAILIILNVYAMMHFGYFYLYYLYDHKYGNRKIGFKLKYYMDEKIGLLEFLAVALDFLTVTVFLTSCLYKFIKQQML